MGTRQATYLWIAALAIVGGGAFLLGGLIRPLAPVQVRQVTVTAVDLVDRQFTFKEESGKLSTLDLRPAWIGPIDRTYRNDSIPPCLRRTSANPEDLRFKTSIPAELATIHVRSTEDAPEQNIMVWIKCATP